MNADYRTDVYRIKYALIQTEVIIVCPSQKVILNNIDLLCININNFSLLSIIFVAIFIFIKIKCNILWCD